MNFEKSTGYINIPDQNVVFTRVDEEDQAGLGDGLGGVDTQAAINEGQKMMFQLQDAQKNANFITDQNIEAPMLLDGIALQIDEQREAKKTLDSINNMIKVKEDDDLEETFKRKLMAEKSNAAQTLFRERQVDNIQDLIYGDQESTETGGSLFDCQRFDVHPSKLLKYRQKPYKKLLKKKFVTGQNKDKILENLMNLSDSDNDNEEKIDKDQLRRIEDQNRKGTKLEKKRKRLENKGIKLKTDSDENSEAVSDEEDSDGAGEKKNKEVKMEQSKEHKPILKDKEEIKKSQFLGVKYGHYKLGTYVRIEIQVEKKFSR